MRHYYWFLRVIYYSNRVRFRLVFPVVLNGKVFELNFTFDDDGLISRRKLYDCFEVKVVFISFPSG